MSNLLLSVSDAMVTFGNKPLFEDLSFNIHQSDRICLVGKNGSGKTTLMSVISGYKELDRGKRIIAPNIKIGYLEQDVSFNSDETVFNFIFNILPEEKQTEDYHYLVYFVTEPLELNPNEKMKNLSGGQLRRACLARSLVEEPDILMLDEPTNHLDLAGIEWLEIFLKNYRGAFLCVSHDKTFLKNISNKVFWLDRGKIRVCPRGFEHFEEWSEMLLDQEARELQRRKKIMEAEVEWATKGIKARRKRNVRRVEEIKKAREKLKQDISSYKHAIKKIEIKPADVELDSKIVSEFYNASKFFETENENQKIILDKFNLKITKGDRIGILGKNGSGKTSFLKMLLGQIKPDAGSVKLSKTVQYSYFDQKRIDLDNSNTLWQTLCPEGGDFVNVAGKQMHVCGYLKKFMFDPKDAKNMVGTLSGGQKNRLMLAKVLANPGNLLILDEPTNDLDMDTLDMLEDILSAYKGTLLVVSHDRDFLDQIVTRILAFEGNGKVENLVGGYSDYLEYKQSLEPENQNKKIIAKSANNNQKNIIEKLPEKPKQKKLSYKMQYDYDNIPEQIKEVEQKIKELNQKLLNPDFYSNDYENFLKASEELSKLQEELGKLESRWLEIDEIISA